MFPRTLDKPEFWYRPLQIVRRCWQCTPFASRSKSAFIQLPWGCTIECNPAEDIGRAIQHRGIYDLVVTEIIWRLLGDAETAVDVGANIGHMTCLMAKRAGRSGRVISFEPSSTVLPTLRANAKRWSEEPGLARIELNHCALSNFDGSAMLRYPKSFGSNEGLASLEPMSTSGKAEVVESIRFEHFLGADDAVGVMKIDVEGHEHSVLLGSVSLLKDGRIRDIVFEEHRSYPSATHDLLEKYGYKIYRLSRTFNRVLLCPANDSREWYEHPIGVLPNYLATLDTNRVRTLLQEPGWQILTWLANPPMKS
jgi:FkbM family methyltransferase